MPAEESQETAVIPATESSEQPQDASTEPKQKFTGKKRRFHAKSDPNKKKKVEQPESPENEEESEPKLDLSSKLHTQNSRLCASYLQQWKYERESWRFQKVRQVWILRHMYDRLQVRFGRV